MAANIKHLLSVSLILQHVTQYFNVDKGTVRSELNLEAMCLQSYPRMQKYII